MTLPEVVLFITGALTLGESFALTIGMYAFRKSSPWRTASNALLLVADSLTGAILVWVAAEGLPLVTGRLTTIWIAIAVVIVTHLFRDLELLWPRRNHFCANAKLVVANNIKLAGTIAWVLFALTA